MQQFMAEMKQLHQGVIDNTKQQRVKAGLHVRHQHKHRHKRKRKPCVNRDDASTRASSRKRNASLILVLASPRVNQP